MRKTYRPLALCPTFRFWVIFGHHTRRQKQLPLSIYQLLVDITTGLWVWKLFWVVWSSFLEIRLSEQAD